MSQASRFGDSAQDRRSYKKKAKQALSLGVTLSGVPLPTLRRPSLLVALARMVTIVRYVRCVHLRRAVTAQRAIEVIEERISAAQRPLNAAAGNADLKRPLYLNCVADAEPRLQQS